MVWLLLLILVGGGVWLYGKLRRMEEEIHAEIEYDKLMRKKEATAKAEPEPQPVEVDADASLEDRILAVISASPGCSQTTIYANFVDLSRDSLQKTLRNMARDGMVRRERKGSSYNLFVVE